MGLAFFQWCESTLVGEMVRTSVWLFPVIEAVHLLGLSLLGGAVLVLDLRLLGVMLGSEPIADLARSTRRWAVAGIGAMVATGVPLFLSEAVKCYYNPSFWVKISTLPVAVAFSIAIRYWIGTKRPTATSPLTRLAGVVSIGLWFTVAAAGRWIGFSS
jgi:hypothetical protein